MSNRNYLKITCLMLLTPCMLAFAVSAFGEGSLEDLPRLKAFRAARQSSFDPSGGNADGRQDWPIQPGETRQLAKIDGPGAITHIWVTISSHDPHHLKNLVLRAYWDGEENPSVEAPIGDFFGLGHSMYYQYSSFPIQMGTQNALNCFWRMPFGKSALVTLTNDGPEPCQAFYYYVDYQQYDAAPENVGYFHAQYRQEYPCTPGQNYTFVDAKGRGHYVGVNLSIHNRADGWWGEGDDMMYIDGEEKPSMNGTGSEDYFCGAWCYGPAFSSNFLGCPLRGDHKRNELWNVYRYHILDPAPFTESIRVTIEHGHANDRSDDFSSVGYWYQTEPHVPFGPMPAAADRLPADVIVFVEEGAEEAEKMAGVIKKPEVAVQPMGGYNDQWSDGAQLWFQPKEPAVYALPVPPIPAGGAGTYKLEVWYTAAPDYGLCELWFNGQKLGEWDGYNDVVARRKADFHITVNEGENNSSELRITGKNEKSTGYFAGIDCFRVGPM